MKKADIQPKVTLVGAGPGDPDLLTLKAVKALNKAKAVLYDALVNEDILEHAPHAVKLYIGKRKGNHSYTQDQINDLLVSYAKKYGKVVRLKGGDPFVFGRGKEETDYLEGFGIKTAIIPGITSAIAVPASVGIPVTHRKVSESFWVITGTTSNRTISSDITLAAQSTATVVILMGMSKLTEIVAIYKQNKRADMPVAVIQNGTKKEAKQAVGTISNIINLVQDKQLSSPAIIIIGEVVNGHKSLLTYFNEQFMEDDFIYQNLDIEPITK
ncbi:uroporphyrinogen-III C-methyltransferase [Formosa sediminum]|uniref:uroporphyrinogen-III C-methyltransferase n=1 Tax=Formosa sediminum TaxID=2594004 RepID=A0A516GQU4_9FLAO|nr:uroporphyrinogen-III C-methyltransferase [Formosa sediminum]QDO93888.1 uroporphyrinogen-III C-methyltransferase [Formosa sediminum]